MHRALLIAACLLFVAAISASARSWRGIVPLHSTRGDVRKLLGTPKRHGDSYDDYELARYTVSINYATENIFTPGDDCDGPAPYWWGDYHVSVGTVLSVDVDFYPDIPLSKLKIPDLKKLAKGEPDSTLSVDYFDAKRGLEYAIREKKVHRITYGPSIVADAGLRCAPDPEADARETRVEQTCRRLFGPMIDSRMGLYAVNSFYVLSLVFDRHGNVISVRVEPKYYYDWVHIDWEERGDFRYLTRSDYEELLAQIDRIRPRGTLLEPTSPTPEIRNFTAWRRETYSDGVLRRGEVADERNVRDPVLVRWFEIIFVKRRAT